MSISIRFSVKADDEVNITHQSSLRKVWSKLMTNSNPKPQEQENALSPLERAKRLLRQESVVSPLKRSNRLLALNAIAEYSALRAKRAFMTADYWASFVSLVYTSRDSLLPDINVHWDIQRSKTFKDEILYCDESIQALTSAVRDARYEHCLDTIKNLNQSIQAIQDELPDLINEYERFENNACEVVKRKRIERGN